MVSAKIGGKTYDRLERYSEEEGISRSQAIDRMLKQGLDVEESDMRLVPVKTDGGTRMENKLDSVENHIEIQSDKIEAQEKYQLVLNTTLIASIVWIFLVLTYSLPSLFVGVSGIGLILILVSSLIQFHRNHD